MLKLSDCQTRQISIPTQSYPNVGFGRRFLSITLLRKATYYRIRAQGEPVQDCKERQAKHQPRLS